MTRPHSMGKPSCGNLLMKDTALVLIACSASHCMQGCASPSTMSTMKDDMQQMGHRKGSNRPWLPILDDTEQRTGLKNESLTRNSRLHIGDCISGGERIAITQRGMRHIREKEREREKESGRERENGRGRERKRTRERER